MPNLMQILSIFLKLQAVKLFVKHGRQFVKEARLDGRRPWSVDNYDDRRELADRNSSADVLERQRFISNSVDWRHINLRCSNNRYAAVIRRLVSERVRARSWTINDLVIGGS